MKDKKGFTLVELLVVIAIIAVIAVIAVPLISKYIANSKEKYYTSLKEELIVIAKNYYANYPKELPRGQLDVNRIPIYSTTLLLSDLTNDNSITNEVVDYNGKECTNTYVLITNSDGKYDYTPCLICDGVNYSSENSSCIIPTNSETEENDQPTCSFSYSGYEKTDWSETACDSTNPDCESTSGYLVQTRTKTGTTSCNPYDCSYSATATTVNTSTCNTASYQVYCKRFPTYSILKSCEKICGGTCSSNTYGYICSTQFSGYWTSGTSCGTTNSSYQYTNYTSQYNCPSGYTKKFSTYYYCFKCTAYATTTTYSCPNGGTVSGTKCSKTCYQTCDTYSSWSDGTYSTSCTSDTLTQCTAKTLYRTVEDTADDNVTVTITGNDSSGINKFVLNGENIEAVDNIGTYVFSGNSNQTYTFYVYDNTGKRGSCTTKIIKINKSE